MVEGLKDFLIKFISGRQGLAITFWLYGVLVALTLDFLISHAVALWQVFFLATITFTHFVLIVVATWNASKLYIGRQLWKWLAKTTVVLNVFKWLWYLPLLTVTLSNAIGFPIHSNEYWELNPKKLTCQPVEYQDTPEMLAKRYQCESTLNSDKKLIMTRCSQGNEVGDFLHTKNQQDCQKYLAKLNPLLKKNNSAK